METSAYKLFALNLLIEGDFQAKSTKSGKTVDYKSKEARDDAIKTGKAVKLDKDKQDKDKEEPKSFDTGDYERDFDDSEPEDKPFGGDTGQDPDYDYETGEFTGDDEYALSGDDDTETDLDINNFEDAKKVQVKIEDSHSQANRLEDDFYKSEEYKELKKGMSREEEIEIFDEIREKIRAVERQLSGAMHDDPNAGDYKDDKELQKRITTYKAKEVDALEDDAKLFVRDPEAFKKELYKKKEGGGDFTKSADYDMWSDEDPEDAGEPDFYDPEDYEKLYPDKTKPKDEVGDIKYGKGFSQDSDHMFDYVAGSASSASDKYY